MDNNSTITKITYNSGTVYVNSPIQVAQFIGNGEIDSIYLYYSNGTNLLIDLDGVVTTLSSPSSASTNLYFNKQQFQNIDANSSGSSVSIKYIDNSGNLKSSSTTTYSLCGITNGVNNGISGNCIAFGNFKFKKYCTIMLYNGGSADRSYQYSFMVSYTPNN